MAHRYRVRYGNSSTYLVVDSENRNQMVFQSNSKIEVISKAQELNGYQPVDGDEGTYGQQIDKEGAT